MRLNGIHHISAITADALGNVDFYTRVLGLRPIAKTVNQDDPTAYHLFYGDEHARPGADLTFFEYPMAAKGTPGAGVAHQVVWRVADADAQAFWEHRLAREGIESTRVDGELHFSDPEGLGHALAIDTSGDLPLIADHPEETPLVDRHGIPKCHCGLPGDQVRFQKGKNPRVWFQCPMPTTPDCLKTQVISCKRDIRRILPIARTTEVYGALRQRRESMEHVHTEWRDRYKCGGKASGDRLRRLGLRPQQLRSNAALLIEWMWTLTRQGWMGDARARVEATPLPLDKYHQRVIAHRKRRGLLGGGQPLRAPSRRVAVAQTP